MGSGLYGIGLSGLAAANAGLVTTGHNIANADTPGFHRQQTVQANATPQLTGSGFIGQGVEVQTVRRVYNDYLETQVGRSQAQAAYYATYSTQVSQIDNLLSDPSAGLAPVLEEFFSAVHEVAANPGSAPSRQAMLSTAQALVTRFDTLDTRLREMNTGANAQIESTVSSVNVYAREVAMLNSRITAAQTSGEQQANDLMDQRDELVSQLNKLAGARALVQSDGTVNVAIGTGQTLVNGPQAFRLEAVQSQEVPGRLDVAYAAGATSVLLAPGGLNGGSLGGLLAFRAGALTDAQNQLGRIAAGLTDIFNSQHRLGQDITGAMGGNFFTPLQPEVIPYGANAGSGVVGASIADATALTASDYRLAYVAGAYQLTRLSDNTTTNYATLPQTVDGITIQLTGGVPVNGDSFIIRPTARGAGDFGTALTNPAQIAAAAPIRTGAALANAGTGTIGAGVVNAPVDVNLQQPVSITFTSATTFNVTGVGTGNPVGVVYTPGMALTYNGWTAGISGTPASGDVFTVSSNPGATADNRNIARLADLQSTATLSGGTATFQAAYGQLTTSVGNTTREMKVSSLAQESIALQTRAAQQAVSGVNLDEEAANLMRYQQAYQASGKVIEIATTLFDTILGIGK